MSDAPFRDHARATCVRCGACPEQADTFFRWDGGVLCGTCWNGFALPQSQDRPNLLDALITWVCDRSWKRFR